MVLLNGAEIDWKMSWGALADGNTIDAVFGKSPSVAKPVKQRLRGIRDEGQKQNIVKAYEELYKALEQHQIELAASFCGGACSEGTLRQRTKDKVEEGFARHGISI
jgi:hypothetical protein